MCSRLNIVVILVLVNLGHDGGFNVDVKLLSRLGMGRCNNNKIQTRTFFCGALGPSTRFCHRSFMSTQITPTVLDNLVKRRTEK